MNWLEELKSIVCDDSTKEMKLDLLQKWQKRWIDEFVAYSEVDTRLEKVLGVDGYEEKIKHEANYLLGPFLSGADGRNILSVQINPHELIEDDKGHVFDAHMTRFSFSALRLVPKDQSGTEEGTVSRIERDFAILTRS